MRLTQQTLENLMVKFRQEAVLPMQQQIMRLRLVLMTNTIMVTCLQWHYLQTLTNLYL